MSRIRNIILIILIILIMILTTVFTYGETQRDENNRQSEKTEIIDELEDEKPEYTAVLVGDIKGKILYGENIDEMHPLASTTKVMTLILTYDAIRKKKASLNDVVTISASAASMGGSAVQYKKGDKVKLKELVEAAAVYSANNAAYALGEHIGNGHDNFIKMMNKRARDIGIGDEVKFYTPTGLPPRMTKKEMDIGTPRGMYKLMLEANKYPEYIRTAKMKKIKVKNGKYTLKNRNNLLGKEGIIGLKTGFHNAAGFNVLIIDEVEDEKIFYVVFGGRTVHLRDEKVLSLIGEKYWENKEDIKVAEISTKEERRRVFGKRYSTEHKMELLIERAKEVKIVRENVSLGLITNPKRNVTAEIYPDSAFSKFVNPNDTVRVEIINDKIKKSSLREGDIIGRYIVFINDKIVHEGKTVVKENI